MTDRPGADGGDDDLGPVPVKLVVWDLDDTMWRGTLSEGPVEVDPTAAAVVRALNRRGIVNSICSKNDHGPVRARLEEAGLWDEFVFASVDWTPKGERVADLVEEMQLRPVNVVFIDDLPLNRAEVARAAPGIRTLDPSALGGLLDQPAVRGGDDPGRTRLQQYRLLERKRSDRERTGGSHEAFLRTCDVRVTLVESCVPEAERLFELLHRTNQLNFTKRRPERDEFDALLADPARRCGYVTVRDRYGEYGICGFWSLSPEGTRLVDFAFSCRILSMGVEQWVYDRLGRPDLEPVGEVAGSVDAAPPGGVDWITEEAASATGTGHPGPGGPAPVRGRVLLVGGCDLAAVAQFLGGDLTTEFSRNGPEGLLVHTEHTDLLRQAAAGLGADELAVVDRLPFLDREVFSPAVLGGGYDVLVYSLLMDYTQGRYRHRETGLVVPWHQGDQDVTDPADWDRVVARFANPAVDAAFLEWFAASFEALGPLSAEEFADNLRWLLGTVPEGTTVILLNGAEVPLDHDAEPDRHLRHRTMNAVVDRVAAAFPGVSVCDVREIVATEADLAGDLRHYRRHVYKAIADRIRELGPDTLVARTPRRTTRWVRRTRRALGLARRRLLAALRPGSGGGGG